MRKLMLVTLGTFRVFKSPNYGMNHLVLCMGHLFSPIKVVVLLEFTPNFPKVHLSLNI